MTEHWWIEVMEDMAGGPMVYKSEADEAIATLTAERDARDEKVRELVEAVIREHRRQAKTGDGCVSYEIDDRSNRP